MTWAGTCGCPRTPGSPTASSEITRPQLVYYMRAQPIRQRTPGDTGRIRITIDPNGKPDAPERPGPAAPGSAPQPHS